MRYNVLLLLFAGWLVCPATVQAASESGIRLYALNCGTIEMKDMAGYSDTGEYDGQSGIMADGCFLIQHPKGWLLWDTGLGDGLVGHPMEMPAFGVRFYETVSLVSQLAQLGLSPKDILFVGISHAHMDHTGNLALFPGSQLLIQKAELAYSSSQSTMSAVDTHLAEREKQAHSDPLAGDHDVFGDGKVKILSTPGHTPGHQSLQIQLARTGTVILSGDLYHLRQNFLHRRVPVYNTNRAETLASEDRIEKILSNTHGRLVIQHDPKDFSALPAFPKYLD
jgi:N-acyl homoserine lactone hydrolase